MERTEVRDYQGIQKNWPQCEIVEMLGKGVSGNVYKIKCTSEYATTFSAVKVMHLKDEAMNDFLQESQWIEELKGVPNIVTVEDSVIDKDDDGYTIYIKMELLESVQKLSHNDFKAEDIVTLGQNICDALSACEQRNIIYGDIDPSNIFMNEHGVFKLGNFGASRNIQISGSPVDVQIYMAPELYREGDVDRTVDIYSLGMILYQLSNHGKLPKVMEGVLPFPDGVDSELGAIIVKACAYNDGNRYQSAQYLKKDLQMWQSRHRGSGDMREASKETSQMSIKPEKKSKGKAKKLIACAVAVLVIAGGGFGGYKMYENYQEKKYQAALEEARDNKDTAQGISLYQDAIELKSDRKEAYVELIDCYIAQKKYGDGLSWIEKEQKETPAKENREIKKVLKDGKVKIIISKGYQLMEDCKYEKLKAYFEKEFSELEEKTYYFSNGNVVDGVEFDDGMIISLNEVYLGEIAKNKRYGEGRYVWTGEDDRDLALSGAELEAIVEVGNWKDGQANGDMSMTYLSFEDSWDYEYMSYVGETKNGKFEGVFELRSKEKGDKEEIYYGTATSGTADVISEYNDEEEDGPICVYAVSAEGAGWFVEDKEVLDDLLVCR